MSNPFLNHLTFTKCVSLHSPTFKVSNFIGTGYFKSDRHNFPFKSVKQVKSKCETTCNLPCFNVMRAEIF